MLGFQRRSVMASLAAAMIAAQLASPPSVDAADPSDTAPIISWSVLEPPVVSPLSAYVPSWLESGALLNDVASGGGRFVALGSWQHIDEYGRADGLGGASGGHNPIGFVSSGGASWAQHDGPYSTALAWRAGRFVSISSSLVPSIGGLGFAFSDDGIYWQAPTLEGALSSVPSRVGAGPLGFVALGRASLRSTRAIVWSSPTGSHWALAPVQPALAGFCPTGVAGGPGGWLAIGRDCRRTSDLALSRTAPVLLRSADGRAWQRVPRPASFAGVAGNLRIERIGAVWVAAGEFAPTGAAPGIAFWASADGRSWHRTGFFRPSAGGETVAGVARLGDGMLAIGTWRGSGVTARGARAWWSADGRRWKRIGIPAAGGVVRGLASDGTTLVAVGYRCTRTGFLSWPACPPASRTWDEAWITPGAVAPLIWTGRLGP